MSTGTRFYNFREGDRSEYLAVYILSAFGLVAQIPRQEDIGFDLICNLAEQEKGILSFRNHFAVSVKSASSPVAVLAPPKSKEEDPTYSEHFNWLFNLELPLMLAVVDKEKQELALYSTLPAWFLYYERRGECGIIELVPRTKNDGANPDVGRATDCGVEAKAGGRRRYQVDLGFPVTVISVNELTGDKEVLKRKKNSLRRVIELGAETARFAQMKTPFFWWFNVTIPGGYIEGISNPDCFNGGVAWWLGRCANAEHLGAMLGGLAPGLMSAALLFQSVGRKDLVRSLGETIRLLPEGSVPAQVKEALPEIFAS